MAPFRHRTRTRSLRPVLALAVVAAGLAFAVAPASAAGTLDPWSDTVAVGGTFSVTAGGCPVVEEETDTGYTYQTAELVLITGSGAGERLAGWARQVSDTRYRFTVPGWVDPDQPAVVAGRCTRITYSFDDDEETTTTVFTYVDAPIDITPGTASPSGPFATLSRDTAAGGQTVGVTITGCEGADYAEAVLFEGGDLSGRTPTRFYAGDGLSSDGSGTFELELALNTFVFDGEDIGGAPLPEGPYGIIAACGFEESGAFVFAEPLAFTISGTNPSGAMTAELVDDELVVSGEGCTGGRTVVVTYEGYAFEADFAEARSAAVDHQRALGARTRTVGSGARLLEVDDEGSITGTSEVTPEPDGTWTVTEDLPEGSFGVEVTADCGDPAADGFRYVRAFVSASSFSDVYVERVSPTSSPTGGPVTIHVTGYCEGDVAVALLDADREVIAESAPIALSSYDMGSGTVTAPATAGEYFAAGTCDGQPGYPDPLQVFAPQTVSGESPLAEEPAEGWPTRGDRETYHGKIGPIDLPAMDMGEGDMDEMAARALGPSGFFIDVPRPEGDFAITKMTFDLVDAQGMPVGQDLAHLHHFVITNRSDKNPACPGGSTFGLPGAIVGAAGAERTVLQTGDPYGIVVEDTDDWTGVYELMSRSMEDQEVYLHYDIDYRRDVDNVRPVTTYFGSATGCSSFTWTVDGLGEPDTQTHYVTIGKAGRLIGAGAHIHNGASHADWTNDRGRRLCRSEITYGDEPVGHHHAMRAQRADEVTETTVVGEPTDEWPAEYYPDDLAIERISNCPLAEQVSAGERLRFDAVYENDRARSGVMGIFTAYVWEGGGPAEPGPPAAQGIPGDPNYTG